MKIRIRSHVILGGVVLVAGCAGFSPTPDDVDRGQGMRTGLDATPDTVDQGSGMRLGLDPAPADVARGRGMDVGLDATPGGDEAPEAASAESGAARKPVAVASASREPGGAKGAGLETAAAAPEAKPEPKPAPKPAAMLRMKFEKGATHRYRNVVEQTIKMPAMGEMADTDTHMEMVVSMSVEDGNAEQGTLKSTFDSMVFKMTNMMMGELAFDTSDPASLEAFNEHMMVQMQPALQQIPAMVGKSVSMTMRADGTMVPGSSVGADALAGGMGPMGSGVNVEQMAAVLAPFPAEAVRVGLSWPVDATVAMPTGGSMKTSGKMTVTAWDEATGIAVIATEATVTMDLTGVTAPETEGMDEGQAAAMAEMMEQIKIKEGTVKGEDTFDVRAGIRAGSKSTTTIVMEMPNPMMPDEGMEMHMTMTMTQELMK